MLKKKKGLVSERGVFKFTETVRSLPVVVRRMSVWGGKLSVLSTPVSSSGCTDNQHETDRQEKMTKCVTDIWGFHKSRHPRTHLALEASVSP